MSCSVAQPAGIQTRALPADHFMLRQAQHKLRSGDCLSPLGKRAKGFNNLNNLILWTKEKPKGFFYFFPSPFPTKSPDPIPYT
jgi:hypothetical protein